MHDELARVAWVRGRRWLVGAALLIGLGCGVGTGVVASASAGSTGVVIAALIGLVPGTIVALVLLTMQGRGRGAGPRGTVGPGDTRETNLADGIAIATGTRPAAVYEVASAAPNVGAIPAGGGGYAVFFTTGATSSLQRDELEALCAAQLAGLLDPHVRRLMAAADRLRAGRLLSTFGAFVLVPAFFLGPRVGSAVLSVAVGAALASWFLAERIRFWGRAGVDAACVATTRHPQALVDALPRLAAWNGPKVKVQIPWGAIGAVDRFWMVPLSAGWTTTTEVNGRTTSTRTAELDEDIALLVRASLVRRVCLESRDADLTTYRDVKRYLREAGRNAAKGRTTEVEGVQVGLGGVVDPQAASSPTGAAGTASIDDFVLGLGTLFGAKQQTRLATKAGVAAAPGIAPGWYPDPDGSTRGWRWWDGRAWTPYASTPTHREAP